MSAGVAIASAHRKESPHERGDVWTAAALFGCVALVMRVVGLTGANDVFIDELTYSSFADQVANGQLPHGSSEPFFLHPPASFALNALAIRIFGLDGSLMDLVLQLRWVNAVLGALTVSVYFLLVRRLTASFPAAAAAAALVLISDPFVLRMNGRVMIETPAGLAVLTGWLLLLRGLEREPGKARTRLELAAGLVFGVALVTKDMTVVFTAVPLLAAMFWRHSLPTTTARRVLGMAAVPYLVYLAVIIANGLAANFAAQKLTGVLRILGVVQVAGFNASPGADLPSRLVNMVGRFGTSYLLLALCPVVGLLAVLSARQADRLVGLLALSAGLFGAYSVAGGAAEEQFGYYVALAALVAGPPAVLVLARRRPSLHRPLAVGTALLCIVSALLGVQARTTQDDGLLQARQWLTTELPVGAKVGLTTETGEVALLPRQGLEVLPSLASLQSGRAQYVLTQNHILRQGYGYAAPELLTWLKVHARPVFRGPPDGDTVIWELDQAALDAAVAAGQTLPPVRGDYP